MAGNRYFSLSLTAIFFLLIGFLRLTFASPTEFFEGDDAAIAAGVSRLCSEEEIGPYFHHPPRYDQDEFAKYKASLSQGKAGIIPERLVAPKDKPFYRYELMTGVYFLGKISCSWGDAAERMLALTFFAGSLFPVFLALFLTKLFSPLRPIVFPAAYLAIAISPELWITGSTYINDKIFSITFLAAAMLLVLYGEGGGYREL